MVAMCVGIVVGFYAAPRTGSRPPNLVSDTATVSKRSVVLHTHSTGHPEFLYIVADWNTMDDETKAFCADDGNMPLRIRFERQQP